MPPSGAWNLWLLEAGRGAGKTEACARYFAGYMHEHPGHRGRIIAPTFGDAVEACVTGPSGLQAQDPSITWLPSAPGGAKVVWPNGSEALVLGTPFPKDVDRLRAGGNRHIDWWEEMAANPQLDKAWEQAEFGLRLGDHPHSIGSTTPRSTPAYRKIRELDGVHRTHATLFDNPHLPPAWVAMMRKRYMGTRMGRQELEGLLIEEAAGALWTRDPDLAADKGLIVYREPPKVRTKFGFDVRDLLSVVVAIDPAASVGPESDETGIIVAGLGADGCAYILDDLSLMGSPAQWATRAVNAFDNYEADRIVAEINNGGDMIEHTLRTIRRQLPYKKLHASRGKRTRAEPIAALYQEGKVFHERPFPALEDQMCNWEARSGDDSPDRLDALVWALTELMLSGTHGKVGHGVSPWA